MGKPAARLTDMHTCPMVTPGTPPIPHVGGPISGPCVPPVLIGFLPAATVGDMCVCVGPPDTIAMGSPTVFIGGKMAARMGDPTVHGGVITLGCPTVLIGEMGIGGAAGKSGGNNAQQNRQEEGSFLDTVQAALDLIGLIPIAGEVADGVNALISVGRGDYAGAALSAAAMIPIAGTAATAGKVASRAAKFAKRAERAESAKHLKLARKILKQERPDLGTVERAKILKGFQSEGFRVREVTKPEKRFRYYDGENAKAGGAWSTSERITTPSERIEKLALPNNKADKVAEIELQPGATVFEGKVAKQKLPNGQMLNGGSDQTFQATGAHAKIIKSQ